MIFYIYYHETPLQPEKETSFLGFINKVFLRGHFPVVRAYTFLRRVKFWFGGWEDTKKFKRKSFARAFLDGLSEII